MFFQTSGKKTFKKNTVEYFFYSTLSIFVNYNVIVFSKLVFFLLH